MRALGLAKDAARPLVVVRTPPTGSAYHVFENDALDDILAALSRANAVVVVLARHPAHREAVEALSLRDVVVPDRAVDGRSLVYQADTFLGMGGTMTREAALLGVPTISAFAGKIPAVDRELERRGLLTALRSPDDLASVVPRRNPPPPVSALRERSSELTEWFVHAVLEAGS